MELLYTLRQDGSVTNLVRGVTDPLQVVTLTGQQLNWLLDGYDITLMSGHKKLEYESLF